MLKVSFLEFFLEISGSDATLAPDFLNMALSTFYLVWLVSITPPSTSDMSGPFVWTSKELVLLKHQIFGAEASAFGVKTERTGS